jgi:uncharacterized LabA/DUF88 family protein
VGVVEKEIIWNKLFASLLEPNDELIRTYWFRPQKVLDSHLTTNNIRNQICYKRYFNYISDYQSNRSNVPQKIIQQIETEAGSVEDWLKQERTRFSQIEYNYDQIALEYGDIEFVKTGIVKVDPYKQVYIGEKGVDIALAVKMIALSVEKKCDKIILISGDYDYAEAIKFIKNNMTKIHLVKFHNGVPPKNKSVSRDLAVLADRVLDIYESDLKTNFLKGKSVNVA